MSGEIFATLDIGSTKITCFIAEQVEQSLKLIGFAQISSFGINRGVVTNMQETAKAIEKVVDQASNMANVDIESINICVGGLSIVSKITNSILVINNKSISQEDIEKIIDIAKAKHLENDRKILHAIPIEYTLDDYSGIKDPLHMVGSKLEAKVNVISIKKDILKNIIKAVEMAGLYIENIISSNVANGYSALIEDEKLLGACLIDFGGFSTDISIYYNGKLVFIESVGIGSHHITSDLAQGLSASLDDAERIKSLEGVTSSNLIESGKSIEYHKVGDPKDKPSFASQAYICSIIQPRTEEILEIISKKIKPYQSIFNNRIVLTGGGANLKGLCELSQAMLGSNVRIANIQMLDGVTKISGNCRFITVAGALLYLNEINKNSENKQLKKLKMNGLLFTLKKAIKKYF